MSARFGRNKRRAARAALETATRELAEVSLAAQVARSGERSARLQQQSMEDEFARLRRTFEEIASLVARESILAGEPTLFSGGEKWDYLQHGTTIRVCPIEPMNFLLDTVGIDQYFSRTLQTEVLRLLMVDKVRDRMKGVIHAHVNLAGHDFAYGISETALRRLSSQELERIVEREIAPKLARMLASELKRVYK